MSTVIPTVTGYAGIQNVSNNGDGTQYQMKFSRSSQERRANIAFSRHGYRGMRELLTTLLGAAAGATATDTYVRAGTSLQGPTAIGPGGARDMETVTTINRATTANDLAFMQKYIAGGQFTDYGGFTYAPDASGNGGGGKVRF